MRLPSFSQLIHQPHWMRRKLDSPGCFCSVETAGPALPIQTSAMLNDLVHGHFKPATRRHFRTYQWHSFFPSGSRLLSQINGRCIGLWPQIPLVMLIQRSEMEILPSLVILTPDGVSSEQMMAQIGIHLPMEVLLKPELSLPWQGHEMMTHWECRLPRHSVLHGVFSLGLVY